MLQKSASGTLVGVGLGRFGRGRYAYPRRTSPTWSRTQRSTRGRPGCLSAAALLASGRPQLGLVNGAHGRGAWCRRLA